MILVRARDGRNPVSLHLSDDQAMKRSPPMKWKGVCYDVGRVLYGNWRKDYDPKIVHRELEILQNDLHCNAVRICGEDVNRLAVASEYALQLGLEVWFSP